MSLSQPESLILEAFKSFFSSNEDLGIPESTESEIAERGLEHLHQQINEMFAQKAASLVHFDSVRGAFDKVHSYKYLENPSFVTSFTRELQGRAVPSNEIDKAVKYVSSITEELRKERESWGERDAGFHPDLDEVMRPEGLS